MVVEGAEAVGSDRGADGRYAGFVERARYRRRA